MRVGDSNFMIPEIPKLNPLSLEYTIFWTQEKDRCLNGYWVAGQWMPGRLYFYINHGHILLNKSKYSKSKSVGKPWLRDIDWAFFRGWEEARGFSGFELDDEYTCNRDVKIVEDTEPDDLNIQIYMDRLSPYCFKPDGTLKKYIPAREYLQKNHFISLGKPLYENEAKNFMMLGNRGFGKSYSVANGIILWEFLFVSNSEVLVGAGESKYSQDLIDKVKFALDNLEGGIYYAGRYFPPPFSKKYTGTWKPGSQVLALRKTKKGNSWVHKGSYSRIKHVSFKNNSFAANGTRPGVIVMEEIGLFSNLEESLGASVESMKNNNVKFGSAMLLGTGGDMEGGGSLDAKKIFYDPEAYDVVSYPDLYENNIKPIAYFVPAYLGLNDFKDSKGNTDVETAKKSILADRDKLKKAKSTKPLELDMMNRPLVPSEAFLSSTGNNFPIGGLKEQLNNVEAKQLQYKKAKVGFIDESLKFIEDSSLRGLEDYPINSKLNNEGCIVIYEFPPKDEIPYGMYIAGLDPYRFNKADTSSSVGAMYIYKRIQDFDGDYDKIVAHYVGRPETLQEFHENCRRLLKYYNAECLYENEVNNFHQFLEMLNEDYLLTDQPDALIKDIIDNSSVKRGKGIYMAPKIKTRAELLTRDWLLTKRGTDSNGNDIFNYHYIYDPGLLKELISYNDIGNFDRVIAFMLTIMLDSYRYKIEVRRVKETIKDEFWEKKLFKRSITKGKYGRNRQVHVNAYSKNLK